MRAAPGPFGNQDHADLLAEIGKALGLDGPLPEWRAGSYTGRPDPSDRRPPHGVAHQVLTGFADAASSRVVWVEEHTRGLRDPEADHYPEDFVDVMINVAGPGAQRLPQISQPPWIRRPGSPRILTHIQQRCRVLAAACRAGELPAEDTYPDLAKDSLHSRPLTSFPAGFARAWNRLPARFHPGGEGARA